MHDKRNMINQFVSRGGIKLQAALDNFPVNVKDKVVLDVGSSTGGFVDCLLQNGSKKVYSVDTAYGELAWKLRNDPRVVVMERTNILHLKKLPSVIPAPDQVRGKHPAGIHSDDKGLWIPDQVGDDNVKVDLITIDAGWTKLELVLPRIKGFLKEYGVIIALLKPHYEADKKDLVKGVLPREIAEKVKEKVLKTINDNRFTIIDSIKSPILGGAGNIEYLWLIKLEE